MKYKNYLILKKEDLIYYSMILYLGSVAYGAFLNSSNVISGLLLLNSALCFAIALVLFLKPIKKEIKWRELIHL